MVFLIEFPGSCVGNRSGMLCEVHVFCEYKLLWHTYTHQNGHARKDSLCLQGRFLGGVCLVMSPWKLIWYRTDVVNPKLALNQVEGRLKYSVPSYTENKLVRGSSKLISNGSLIKQIDKEVAGSPPNLELSKPIAEEAMVAKCASQFDSISSSTRVEEKPNMVHNFTAGLTYFWHCFLNQMQHMKSNVCE